MKNYYEELEVSRNASKEVINRAYKVLAKKYHPDTTTENKQFAEERFKKISEAYEILSNDQKRAEYNKTLQPEIDSDKYNKILQDNRLLSKELQNLKNQLNNVNTQKKTYSAPPKSNNSNPSRISNNYNTNQNTYYTQPNYNQNNSYYPPRQTVYRKQYSFLDEIKYKLKEIGKKIFAIIITILIMISALGVLYIIPTTRNFLVNDLQLGMIFAIFK